MKHDKIINRSDGSRLRIEVRLVTFAEYARDKGCNLFRYDVIEWIRGAGKRKETITTGNANASEIYNAKLELHQQFKT